MTVIQVAVVVLGVGLAVAMVLGIRQICRDLDRERVEVEEEREKRERERRIRSRPPEGLMKRACKDCEWVDVEGVEDGMGPYYRCHRHAPSPAMTDDDDQHKERDLYPHMIPTREDWMDGDVTWPWVKSDDWCGEWRGKPDFFFSGSSSEEARANGRRFMYRMMREFG